MEIQELNREKSSTDTIPAEKAAPKKRGRLLLAVALLLLACALIAAAVTITLDGRHVRFYISGEQSVTLECGESYREPGVYAVATGRLFGESQEHLPVTITGEVDSEKPGSYPITYAVRYRWETYSAVRLVHVLDTKAPEISLHYTEGYHPSWFDGYEEEGYTALDACDGDLTDKVERQVLPDRVLYSVTDASGNIGRAVRMLDYSGSEPEIRLNGGERLELRASMAFNDPGYRALDQQGNDVTELVQVEGEVCPYETGEYQLRYSLANAMGDTLSVTRTVTVVPADLPQTVDPSKNTIYLTFDDGPGPYTGWLLDILAAYNVKATFFVTCLNSDYSDMIGRAFREGHSIGVHTAAHNYYKIYESEEAFFEDFNQVQELIYQQTGEYTNLFRFPGGSSNTVSSFNAGIMSRLAKDMRDMGYQYFDWNVDSGDAGGTVETKEIVQNIKEGCEGHRACIVLQHDIKDYSVAAVEEVIRWGQRNGYQFSALDMSSPAAHHGIAN